MWQFTSTSVLHTPQGEEPLTSSYEHPLKAGESPRILSVSHDRVMLHHAESIGIYAHKDGNLQRSQTGLPPDLKTGEILAGGFFVDAPEHIWLLAKDGLYVTPPEGQSEWRRYDVNWGNIGSAPISVTATLKNPDLPIIHGNFFAFSHNSIYYVRTAP